MTEISNRTGIAAELTFLRTWGLAFRQAFKDHPSRTYFKRHEETCLGAYQMLTGKPPCFKGDVKSGLMAIRKYLESLHGDKAFSAELAKQHFDNLDSIEKILFEPKQTSLFQ